MLKLKNQFQNTTKKNFKTRVAKLAGGVAVIKIGAATEVEMKEKKDRVDDALHATRAAVEEGVVAGGGVALVRAAERHLKVYTGANDDQNVGINILRRAIEAPLRQIVANSGDEPSVVMNAVKMVKVTSVITLQLQSMAICLKWVFLTQLK